VHGNVVGYDWAVLRLYEPLGSSLGYFGYNSYSIDWNDLTVWSNIRYPGDIDNAEELAFQEGFTIKRHRRRQQQRRRVRDRELRSQSR